MGYFTLIPRTLIYRRHPGLSGGVLDRCTHATNRGGRRAYTTTTEQQDEHAHAKSHSIQRQNGYKYSTIVLDKIDCYAILSCCTLRIKMWWITVYRTQVFTRCFIRTYFYHDTAPRGEEGIKGEEEEEERDLLQTSDTFTIQHWYRDQCHEGNQEQHRSSTCVDTCHGILRDPDFYAPYPTDSGDEEQSIDQCSPSIQQRFLISPVVRFDGYFPCKATLPMFHQKIELLQFPLYLALPEFTRVTRPLWGNWRVYGHFEIHSLVSTAIF